LSDFLVSPFQALGIFFPVATVPDLKIAVHPDHHDFPIEPGLRSEKRGDQHTPLGIDRTLGSAPEKDALQITNLAVHAWQCCGCRERLSEPLPFSSWIGDNTLTERRENQLGVALFRPRGVFLVEDFSETVGDAEASLFVKLKLEGSQEHVPSPTLPHFLPLDATTLSPGITLVKEIFWWDIQELFYMYQK